jgi:hypothetical protein
MDRSAAVSLFHRFHQAQSSFYAGGQDTELRALLSEDITWQVPGCQPGCGRLPRSRTGL